MAGSRQVRVLVGAFLAASAVAVAAAPSGAAPARILGFARGPSRAKLRVPGEIAFVRSGRLFVWHGRTGLITEIKGPGTASYPQWSRDGHWLAYGRTMRSDQRYAALWLVRADGRLNHEVEIRTKAKGAPMVAIGPSDPSRWSPRRDTLLASAYGPDGTPDGLWLVRPSGPIRKLVNKADAGIWSADGSTVAYVTTQTTHSGVQRTDALYTVPTATRKGMKRQLLVHGASIVPIRFWPGRNKILIWLKPLHLAELAVDGVILYAVDLATGRADRLAVTLSIPAWVTGSPASGELAIIANTPGSGRFAWSGKALLMCRSAEALVCETLPGPPDTVAQDPSWSKQGALAVVRAKDRGGSAAGFKDEKELSAWLGTRELWTKPPSGSALAPFGQAGHGIYDPMWSADGRWLMYVQNKSAIVLSADGRHGPISIIDGLKPTLYPYGDHGFLDFSQVIAWHS